MKTSWKLLSDGAGILEALLKNRGIDESESKDFLEIPLPSTGLAKKLLSLESELGRSAALINQAINEGRPIIIHGDYDVDGISATAILWRTIYQDLAYLNCHPFIPNRFDHGYGLSRESIDEILGKLKSGEWAKSSTGISALRPLLITVDCGITASEEVAHIQDQGFEVLVVDHHTQSATLPNCQILWSDKLCAGGLAWVLSQALKQSDPSKYLDLAALATVADLQPLLGFNRSLVKFGLERINAGENIGLKALLKVAGVEGKEVGTFEIGWVLAPRINAAGRLESAWESLRLLCTEKESQAIELAAKLNELNIERQTMTKDSLDLALALTASQDSRISVIAHEDFHEGLIGLVAGRLVGAYGQPAVVICKGEEFSKASARSVEGFNIVEFLRSLGNHFENIGGHAGAAGFTIRTEKLADLLQSISLAQLNLEIPKPSLEIDSLIGFEKVDSQLLEEIKKLSPFGLGNKEPVFLSRGTRIDSVSLVGKDKSHLKLLLSSLGQTFPALYFGQGYLGDQLKVGDLLDTVFTLSEDWWNGRKSISLKIKDLDQVKS